MKTIRDTILVFIGAGLLFTFITGIDLSDFQNLQSETPQSTDTPVPEVNGEQSATGEVTESADPDVSGTATATYTPTDTPTPTPAITLIPSEIVIYGEMKDPCAESASYEPFTIIVAEHSGENIDPVILHPPVHPAPDQNQFDNPFCPESTGTPTQKTEAFLEVIDSTNDNCLQESFSTPSATPITSTASVKCYQVSVIENANLRPGEYRSTLFISPKEGIPASSANVSVKVRLSILWPILAVVLGVLATEFLVGWRKRLQYSTDWSIRRIQWFDLLSEKTDWIRQPMEEDARYEVLKQVKMKLRAESKKLNDWIDNGRKGEVKIGQVPENRDAAKERVYLLRSVVDDHLTRISTLSEFNKKLKNLSEAYTELTNATQAEQFQDKLKIANNEIDSLNRLFKKFKRGWEQVTQFKEKLENLSEAYTELTNATQAEQFQDKLKIANNEVDSLNRLFKKFEQGWEQVTQFKEKLENLNKVCTELDKATYNHVEKELKGFDDKFDQLRTQVEKNKVLFNIEHQIENSLKMLEGAHTNLDKAIKEQVTEKRNVVSNDIDSLSKSVRKDRFEDKLPTASQFKSELQGLKEVFSILDTVSNDQAGGPLQKGDNNIQSLKILVEKIKYEDKLPTASGFDTNLKELKEAITTLVDVPNDQLKKELEVLTTFVQENMSHFRSFSPFDKILNELEVGFEQLGEKAASQSRDYLNNGVETIKDLYDKLEKVKGDPAYDALKNVWKRTPPPNDEKLKVAWNIIEEILANTLKNDFDSIKATIDALPTKSTTTKLATYVDVLAAHLSRIKTEIVDKAVEQQAAIKEIADQTNGKTETEEFLKLLTNLETDRSNAEQKVISAEQPMNILKAEADVKNQIKKLEDLLAEIDRKIDELSPSHLSKNALLDLMLKPVQEDLAKADEEMSKPQTEADMTQIWERIRFDYGRSKRWVKVGKQLIKLYKNWKEDEIVKRFIVRGYKHLLNGEPLRAEVELERAENEIASKGVWQRSMGWGKNQAQGFRELTKSIRGWWNRLTKLKNGVNFIAIIAIVFIVIVFGIFMFTLLFQPVLLTFGGTEWDQWLILPIIGIIIIAIVIMVRIANYLGIPTMLREVSENVFPWVGHAILVILSKLLTVVVAVALILVANELVGSAETWGSPFDFLTAFTWGIFANSISKPVQSSLERVSTLLEGAAEETASEPATSEESKEG